MSDPRSEIELDEAIDRLLQWNAARVADLATPTRQVPRTKQVGGLRNIVRAFSALMVVGLGAATLILVAGLRGVFELVPGSQSCSVSEAINRGQGWIEYGGPDLWVVSGQKYTALGSHKLFLRLSPEITPTDNMTVFVESPPGVGRAGSLSAVGRLTPLRPSNFEDPPPSDLDGQLFFVVQGFPVAGCWQIHVSVSGQVIDGPVVSVAVYEQDRVGACNPTPVTDNRIAAPTWSVSGEVTDLSASRTSSVRVDTQRRPAGPAFMVASRLDPPKPNLDALVRVQLPDTDISFPLRLGPGCWRLTLDESADSIVISVDA